MSVESVERIARECFRSFRFLPGAKVIDDGRLSGVMTNVPINFFSGIAMSDIEESDVPRVIASMDGRPFRWWISPSTRPANLAAILVGLGMHHTYDAPGMTADLAKVDFDAPLPRGLDVRRADALDDWERVFLEGFQRPGRERGLWSEAYSHCDDTWTHFVGYLDGKPVSTTSILMCGELAGVYHVVTLPPARGRGVGKATTVAAMKHAKELGATQAALQSSEMGFSVYRAIGFEKDCDLVLYDWRSSSATA